MQTTFGATISSEDAMTARERQPNRGFTLIEVLMVIGIIGMALMVILPSVGKLFDSAADGQGRNLITAQLKAARSLAIRDRIHTGVHFQRHWKTGRFWAAIMQATTEAPTTTDDKWIDLGADFGGEAVFDDIPVSTLSQNGMVLVLAEGAQPVKLPGSLGVGVVLSAIGDNYANLAGWRSARRSDNIDAFTTFTIMFDPDGRLVDRPAVGGIAFVREYGPKHYCSPLFVDRNPKDPADPTETRSIWSLPKYDVSGYVDTYVKAVCVFDGSTYDNLPDSGPGSTKPSYLNDNAAFMPVAPYVGGLIRTSVD